MNLVTPLAMTKRKNKGFTLVELLVVVLIIGILAAIAVPQYFKVVEKARYGELLNAQSTIVGSEERMNSRTGAYVATFDSLDVSLPDNSGNGMSGASGTMKYYTVALAGVSSVYTIVFTRYNNPPSRYGSYIVSFVCGPGAPCTAATTGNATELTQ